MSSTRVRIDPDDPVTFPEGRIAPSGGGRNHRGGDCLAAERRRRRSDAGHGAVRALLRVLDKAPETALRVLT